MPGRMSSEYSDVRRLSRTDNDAGVPERTCITSRSWTYLRSVSTISLIMLFRAASCALAGTGTEGVDAVRESVESSGIGGDGGATSVKTCSGRALRRTVTV